jgi:transcription elongation factor GreA
MGKEKTYIFTKEGFNKLLKELEYRKNELRNKLRDTLDEMRQRGDLSENDGYSLALEESQANESEILEMEEKVKNAEVVEGNDDSKVDLGDTVVLEDQKKNTQQYQIVGEDEANPLEGKISFKSPIGNAILGKKKGQNVEIDSPAGKVKWSIKAIN